MFCNLFFPFGDSNIVCCLLVNTIGRIGVFLMCCYIGKIISNNRFKLGICLLKYGLLYTISFLFFDSYNYFLTPWGITSKEILTNYILGTYGYIWILYGAVVFVTLLLLNKFVSHIGFHVPLNFWILLAAGGVIAFVYLNGNVILFRRNEILYNFTVNIFGTPRPAIIAACPFMLWGYVPHRNISSNALKFFCFISGSLWVGEIYFLHYLYGLYNIHLTLAGTAFIASLFILISSQNQMRLTEIDLREKYMDGYCFWELLFFGISYTGICFLVTYPCYFNTLEDAIILFIFYIIICTAFAWVKKLMFCRKQMRI